MKENKATGGSDEGWNSDDVLFGNISCKKLSRFCTCYVSALRIGRHAYKAKGAEGVVKFLSTVLNQQLAILNSDLTEAEKKKIKEGMELAILSTCMAAMSSIDVTIPAKLSEVAITTLDAVHQLTETTGPIGADDEVIIQIRKVDNELGEATIQMGLNIESSGDLVERIMKDKLGKTIGKVVMSNPSAPEQTKPGEQGLN